MAGRKHLMVEAPNGKVTKHKLDPANIAKQRKEFEQQGCKTYIADDDDLIKYGIWMKGLKKKK